MSPAEGPALIPVKTARGFTFAAAIDSPTLRLTEIKAKDPACDIIMHVARLAASMSDRRIPWHKLQLSCR